jgi:hypothetical protein
MNGGLAGMIYLSYICTRNSAKGELSSVGSERLPYKQRVGGSTPSAPTKKDLFRIPEEVFFYVYVPPECYGKSWGKSKTDQALNLRSCFELFEMFFEVKNLHFLPALYCPDLG